ncbi:hypothetical protein AAVH_43623, partial [Aphelenchoides avenae]
MASPGSASLESPISNGGNTVGPLTPLNQETRVYAKRYFILVMFICLSASNALQWIEYSIIAHIIKEFYGVEFSTVD